MITYKENINGQEYFAYDDIPVENPSPLKDEICLSIRLFSEFPNKKLRKLKIKLLFHELLNRIIPNKKGYKYKHNDTEIPFKVLTDNYPELYKDIKEHNGKTYNCFEGSVGLTLGLLNFEGYDKVSLRIGYIRDFNAKYIHAVVLVNLKEREYILDFARNIMMKKSDFDNIYDFEELSLIEGHDLLHDLEVMDQDESNIGLSMWVYAVNREQIFSENNMVLKRNTTCQTNK